MASSIGLRIGSAYRRAFYETGPAVTRANETTRPVGNYPGCFASGCSGFRLVGVWGVHGLSVRVRKLGRALSAD